MTFDNETGQFVFDHESLYFQSIPAGEQVTLVYSFDVQDDSGDTLSNRSSSTVTVTITGTNQVPTASDVSLVSTDEDTPLTVDLTNYIADIDTGSTLTVVVTDATTSDNVSLLSHFTVSGTNITFNPQNTFQYLGVGESALLTVTYHANDSMADSTSRTIQIQVNGLNDTPTIVSSTAAHVILGNSIVLSLQYAQPDEDEPAVIISDPDVNDVNHVFYQFKNHGFVGGIWQSYWQTIPDQNENVQVYDSTGNLLGCLSCVGSSDENTLDRTKLLFTPDTTTEYLSSRTSDIVALNIGIDIKVANGVPDDNRLVAEYTQDFAIFGQHFNPVVQSTSLVLPSHGNSLEATAAISALLSPGYEISTGDNSGWQLGDTLFVENTEYDNEWFSIDRVEGIVSFRSEEARNSFMNSIFTDVSLSSLDVLIAVQVSDQASGSEETGLASEPTTITLQITRQMAPQVTPQSIDITSATQPETANSLDFEMESVFSFEKDPIRTGHSLANWYYFELLHVDTTASTIRIGNETISLADYSGFQNSSELFAQSVMNNASVGMNVDTGTSFFHLNLMNHHLFTFLPDNAEIVLWFNARLNDLEYYNCAAELSFAVHITGVSEAPVITADRVDLFTTEDHADANPTGTLSSNGSVFYDNDSTGPFNIQDVTLSGGQINYTSYTNEELADWFGVTVGELASCLMVTGGLDYEFNLSFQKEGKMIFQQIPQYTCVNLYYSYNISDELGNVSETSGIGIVTINGTDQQPYFSDEYDKSFTIDLRQENTGRKRVNLFQGEGGTLEDIDKTSPWEKQTFCIQSASLSNESGILSGVNYMSTDFYTGNIIVNIDELADAFSLLSEGETRSLTYACTIVSDTGILIGQKELTITIIGVNNAPILSSFSQNIDLASASEMEVDWRSFVENDDTGQYITMLNGQSIPSPENMNASGIDLPVYSPEGVQSGFLHLSAVEANGVLTHRMVYRATDSNGVVPDALKWGLQDGQTLPISCSLQVADQYGLCSSDNTFTIVVTGAFDPLQLNLDASTIFTVAANTDSDYLVATPENIICLHDNMTFYEFNITGMEVPDGVNYNWQNDDVMICYDYFAQSVSVLVNTDALTRQDNPLVAANHCYTVHYTYCSTGGMNDDSMSGTFALKIVDQVGGLDSTDISLDLTSAASQLIYEQTENDSASVSLMNFSLSDPEGGSQTVSAYTVHDQVLVLVEASGIEDNGMFDYVDGLVDSIEALASIENGVFTFTNTFTTYNTHNSDYNLSVFSFLCGAETIDGEPRDAEYLDLKFSYVIADYTVDGTKYDVPSTGYITVRVVGENNTPIAVETLLCDPEDSASWVMAEGDQTVSGDLLECPPAWDFDGGRFDYGYHNGDNNGDDSGDGDNGNSNTENGGNDGGVLECNYPYDYDIDYSSMLIRNSQGTYVPFANAIDKDHAITITDDVLCWANIVENGDGEMELNGFCINTGATFSALASGQTATLDIYFKISDYAGAQTASNTSKFAVVIHGNATPSGATCVLATFELETYEQATPELATSEQATPELATYEQATYDAEISLSNEVTASANGSANDECPVAESLPCVAVDQQSIADEPELEFALDAFYAEQENLSASLTSEILSRSTSGYEKTLTSWNIQPLLTTGFDGLLARAAMPESAWSNVMNLSQGYNQVSREKAWTLNPSLENEVFGDAGLDDIFTPLWE